MSRSMKSVKASIAHATPVADVVWLNAEEIEPSPFQYRRTFPEQQMAELTLSILEHGVLQPVLVRPVSGKKHAGIHFQLVAGERRWRASQEAARENPERRQIPAIVRGLNDFEAQEIALIENVQREDPDDYAIACGLRDKMKLHAAQGEKLSERALARMISMSEGFVRNHLGLFKLRPKLQEVAKQHSGIKSSLFEIQKVNNPDVEEELIEAIKSGASFSAIQQRVERFLADERWKHESQQEPDEETAQAGRRDTKRVREAKAHIATALSETERHLHTVAAWTGEIPAEIFERDVQPQLERLHRKLNDLKRKST